MRPKRKITVANSLSLYRPLWLKSCCDIPWRPIWVICSRGPHGLPKKNKCRAIKRCHTMIIVWLLAHDASWASIMKCTSKRSWNKLTLLAEILQVTYFAAFNFCIPLLCAIYSFNINSVTLEQSWGQTERPACEFTSYVNLQYLSCEHRFRHHKGRHSAAQ